MGKKTMEKKRVSVCNKQAMNTCYIEQAYNRHKCLSGKDLTVTNTYFIFLLDL